MKQTVHPFRTSRRHFLKTMGIGASAAALAGCGDFRQNTASVPPNILWITCEDIGPALGCYGDSQAVTPNLDRLATEGVIYRKAYATAPICAPSRSCLITGLYATSLGTQHLRSEIPRPEFIKCIPQYLREAGYFCTNNSKTDYNFVDTGIWDENSTTAHWRNRSTDKPFFSVFNFGVSHEGQANSYDESNLRDLETRHDPAQAELPPYYPDTPEMRSIWARQYDLITVMDRQAGEILQQLEADGLAENTIVFFFSDHGYGLPRYKRWCYNSGLHVPFIVRIPPMYRHLSDTRPGTVSDRMVSFVDFAPTVLGLAGVSVPDIMEGTAFLGPEQGSPRDYFIGARSRADDVYDKVRAVIDERYIYIRNYFPHLPYIREALIFDGDKRSFIELRRVRAEGNLPPLAEAMFQPRPREELYDLQSDPWETSNIVEDPANAGVLETMRARLNTWIMSTKDTGFLLEPEMMIRSDGSTPYEMTHDPAKFDLPRILAAAEMVGDNSIPMGTLESMLDDPDSGVRFWVATSILARRNEAGGMIASLVKHLDDPSPTVAIAVAELLCQLGRVEQGRPVLVSYLKDSARPWVVLQAAQSIRNIGDKAKPVVPDVREVFKLYAGTTGGRYASWSYPMFIGFALDQVLLNCGEELT